MWLNRHSSDFQFQWKLAFRMNGLNYEKLVDLVRPLLEKHDTQMRKATPIEKRIPVALWRLSTGNSFRTVLKTLAIGKSAAVTITHEFCTEIFTLSPKFIMIPVLQLETEKVIENFKQDCNYKIPQALGAIDGTHIFIKTPEKEQKYDYYCRKQLYSVNTQAIVGANLLFLDVPTGFPGSMHDTQVLKHSSLFLRAEQNAILKNCEDIINNLRARPLLLGDSRYLLCKWLMKPYSFTPALNGIEQKFNKKLSSSRATVERLFGICNAHWRCLLKWLDSKVENVLDVIIICFVLHHFCQNSGETYLDQDGIFEDLIQKEKEIKKRRGLNNIAFARYGEIKNCIEELYRRKFLSKTEAKVVFLETFENKSLHDLIRAIQKTVLQYS